MSPCVVIGEVSLHDSTGSSRGRRGRAITTTTTSVAAAAADGAPTAADPITTTTAAVAPKQTTNTSSGFVAWRVRSAVSRARAHNSSSPEVEDVESEVALAVHI